MTFDELHAEMVKAMKAKDKVRLGVIRLVVGELKNLKAKEGRDLTEEDVTSQVKRSLKQTNETLEMPAQVAGDELTALIEKTIAELGVSEKKDMGRVMGALTKATNGNFDKPAAAKEVGARLS